MRQKQSKSKVRKKAHVDTAYARALRIAEVVSAKVSDPELRHIAFDKIFEAEVVRVQIKELRGR